MFVWTFSDVVQATLMGIFVVGLVITGIVKLINFMVSKHEKVTDE
jgi:hypothetical protein